MNEETVREQIADRLNAFRAHAEVLAEHGTDPRDLAFDYAPHITTIVREALLSEEAIRAVTGSDEEELNVKARHDMDTALTAAGLGQEYHATLQPYSDPSSQ